MSERDFARQGMGATTDDRNGAGGVMRAAKGARGDVLVRNAIKSMDLRDSGLF